ncbi:probable membrane-associated kinase regulator 2 [Phragmites australis]|uniref:probable membrane-associated kinase regulator 2 n=1 Tax=Phragmites australis TaxID=29695 RepID=UPI002D76FD54|nr:probable membrane-associated kinase regulator 2 [Phragmites australis]
MESFSFLKYLRGGAVAGNQRAPVPTTTIAASVCEDGGGGGTGGGGDVDDATSFFDLEFAVPGDESAASDAEEERVEFNFAVSGDDVASGGEVVAVDAVAPGEEPGDGKDDAEAAEVAPPPASFLRPATKFRVLLLKLRKPKVPVPGESNGGGAPAAKVNRFLIKFRVDDAPLVSLFTRDNSSRSSDAGAGADKPAAVQAAQPQDAAAITAEERLFVKEVLLKYLNKIRPLYVKVSRRYGERLRFAGASEGEETDAEHEPSPAPSPTPSQPPSLAAPAPAPQPVVVACGVRAPRASVPAGLKQVCKRLGKSRSASSAVAAAPSPPPPSTPQPQRRDDSLLQLQDGIQSAIAHCKRSFNASKGSESPPARSMTMSDPRDGRADTNDGA